MKPKIKKVLFFGLVLFVGFLIVFAKRVPKKVLFTIETNPSGAGVRINSEEISVASPRSVSLDSKEIITVQVEKDGYYTYLKEVDISKLPENKISITLDPLPKQEPVVYRNIHLQNPFYPIDTPRSNTIVGLNYPQGVFVYNDGSGFKKLLSDKLFKIRKIQYSRDAKKAIVESIDIVSQKTANAFVDFSKWTKASNPVVSVIPIDATSFGLAWNDKGTQLSYLLSNPDNRFLSTINVFELDNSQSTKLGVFEFEGAIETYFPNETNIIVVAQPSDGPSFDNQDVEEYVTGTEVYLLTKGENLWSKKTITKNMVSEEIKFSPNHKLGVFFESKNIVLIEFATGKIERFEQIVNLEKNPNRIIIFKDNETLVYVYKIDDKTVSLNYIDTKTHSEKQHLINGSFEGNLTNFEMTRDNEAIISTSRGYNLVYNF